MPVEVFKEHILGLQMCGEDILFADLPSQSKSAFTKIYNQVNKSSITAVSKSKKRTPTDKNLFSGANFDPDFMSEPSDDGEDSEESEKENDVVATNAKGKAKKVSSAASKPAAKVPKAAKETKPAANSSAAKSGGGGKARGRGRQ